MGNPLDFFEAGRKGGKANQSPFVDASANVMSAFDQQAENQMKMNQLMGLEKYKSDLKSSQPLTAVQQSTINKNKSMADVNDARAIQIRSGKGSGHLTAEDMADRKTAVLKATGAGSQSTPINAALQSLKSARNSKKILFPDGTAKSFRADIATEKHPLLGRPMLSKDAQNLAREYGIALDLYNRQVTGAAFSQPELKQRLDQFRLNLLSNPEAAYDSLTRLEELNTDYLKIADPKGIFTGEDVSGTPRADVAQDGSTTKSPEAIKQKYAQALAKYPNKRNAILGKYKQETGMDYDG